jgi:hypothetical protein
MQGFFISTIFPVRSLISRLTRLRTRYVPPQYGTNSASQYMPRLRLSSVIVFRISSWDLTRTSSPG